MAPDLLIELNPVVLCRFQARAWQELIAAVRELYPHVFYVRGDGAIVEPLSRSHWRRLLGRYGLLDLYATFDPNRAAAAGMARVGQGGLDARRRGLALGVGSPQLPSRADPLFRRGAQGRGHLPIGRAPRAAWRPCGSARPGVQSLPILAEQ
jgi:hypothetical protein